MSTAIVEAAATSVLLLGVIPSRMIGTNPPPVFRATRDSPVALNRAVLMRQSALFNNICWVHTVGYP
jgi:hypothetical protein